MRSQEVIDIVNDIHLQPGWNVTGIYARNSADFVVALFSDYDDVVAEFTFEAPDSNRKYAKDGYPVRITPLVPVRLEPESLFTRQDVEDTIMRAYVELTVHELREFFKTGPNFNTPFHPHTADGDQRWSDLDFTFEHQQQNATREEAR